MQNFMPWHGLVGGMMIGLSAALFLLLSGRMSGISGIVETALAPSGRSFGWSLAYLAGLPLGALLVSMMAPQVVPAIKLSASWPLLVGAGLLVGLGARIGSGCTSGHGVCGLPRLSVRSIVATGTFMLTAAATVYVTRHVL
ncbi:MAG: YeeE/YedE family protein [Hyphomicrobiaceae bacterium]